MKYILTLSCILLALSFCNPSNGQAVDDYRTKASGNWNSNSTWQRYNGTTWVNVNGSAPNTIPASGDGAITILNTHTVTVSANVSVDQVTVNTGGQITVSSGKTLTVLNGTGTDLVVNGAINNDGTITTTGTVSFGANSTYTHTKNGGTIPTAAWAVTSTCIITGVTGSTPGGLGQSFGNFTWNCTGQSSDRNLNGALTTVNGDFTVASTGSDGVLLELTDGSDLAFNIGGDFKISGGDLLFTDDNANVTVNVAGNFSQTGGSLDYSDDNQIGVLNLNVSGDFFQSAGSFDFASGNASATRRPALNLSGNFSQTGTGKMTTSTSDDDIINGTITFNKNGSQTFGIVTQGNTTYTDFIVNAGGILQLNSNLTLSSNNTDNWAGSFTINSNGTLNAGTYQLLSSGSGGGTNNDFILNSGASILTANTNGLQSGNNGTISTSIDNRVFSSAANYTFNGTATQNSGVFTTTPTANQVNNLTVNNTGGSTGVTLQQAISVAGTCYFTAGLITSGSTYLLIFNDNATASGANNNVTHPSYVNGPVRKTGNDAFTFPVGKSNVGYMPCGISAPSHTTDAFTAEYKRNSATALGPISASGLYRISACEYWVLDRTTGSSSVNVTLSWSGLSPCNAAAYVTQLSSLAVVHFNGVSWNAYGNNGGITGNGAAGTVTWNNVSAFSPFTLGSTSAVTNPLPIKFSAVKAYKVNNGNRVEWTNLTEENLQRYEVERSANGTSFNMISTVAPRANNNQEEEYAITDENILNGTNYYRIKAVQLDGSAIYSAIVKVDPSSNEVNSVVIYPNPVESDQFTLQLNNYKKGNYTLKLISNNGQQLMNKTVLHPGGSVSITIDKPISVKPGLYIVQVTGADVSSNLKLVVN